MQSKITLIGFYNFLKSQNDDLFSGLDFPDGIDKSVFVNSLLAKGGEFPVLYSDPYFMQSLIVNWSKKWNHTFQKWISAINFKYDPLYNYDRYEEWTEDEKIDENVAEKNYTKSTSESNGTTASENRVSAYNADTYQPNSKDSGTAQDKTDQAGEQDSSTDRDSSRANIKKGRAYGNIGVTTSQQMLQSEIDVAKWNLYDNIADLFITEFCIPIYI